jgi:hypothetical protein
MTRAIFRFAPLFVLLFPAAASAQEGRDLCPDRPGLNTPACTIDAGRVQVEVSLADWARSSGGGVRSDELLLGDTLVRIGVSDSAELRIGWTPYGEQRVRDRLAGTRASDSGSGELTLGVKYNLMSPDGSGTSVGLLPSVTLPTGSGPLDSGDWSAAVQLPVSFDLGNDVSFGLTPEISAAVDGDGDGRHAAYALTAGFGFAPVDNLAVAIEAQVARDDDPTGGSTAAIAGVALGYQIGEDSQIDIGSQFGLNRNAADVELYVGVSRRF